MIEHPAPHGWLCDYRGRRLRPATKEGRSRRSSVVDRHRRLIVLTSPLGLTLTEDDLGYVSPWETVEDELRKPGPAGLLLINGDRRR